MSNKKAFSDFHPFFRSGIFHSVCLLTAIPLVFAQIPKPNSLDWPSFGNDLGGMHYVNVDQINSSNISTLKPAWIFHLGVFTDSSSLEGQPLIVNGIVYVTSPHGHVFAIDGATGAHKWGEGGIRLVCGSLERVAPNRKRAFMTALMWGTKTLVPIEGNGG